MRKLTVSVLLLACLTIGCSRPAADGVDWIERDTNHRDVTISLGQRAVHEDNAAVVEPIAMIERDGSPVADAMVFVSLVSESSQADTTEVATVYELSPLAGQAFYGQGKLPAPAVGKPRVVRFRIVLPDVAQSWSKEVTLPAR